MSSNEDSAAPVPKPRPKPRPRPRANAPTSDSDTNPEQPPPKATEKPQPEASATGESSAPSIPAGTASAAPTGSKDDSEDAPPPLPTREGRKPLEEEKQKKIRVRRRPNKLKEKPTRPPPPTPVAVAAQRAAATTAPDAGQEGMYESFADDASAATQRISSLANSQTQGDYVAPVDPVAPSEMPPPRPNRPDRRPPPLVSEESTDSTQQTNSSSGGGDATATEQTRTATTHGAKEEVIYDDGVTPEPLDANAGGDSSDKDAHTGEDNTPGKDEQKETRQPEEEGEEGDMKEGSSGNAGEEDTKEKEEGGEDKATPTGEEESSKDEGGDTAAAGDGEDGDDEGDEAPPVPPAPYKADSESATPSQPPSSILSPKMKKKRSWPTFFGRRNKGSESGEDAEYLSKVTGDTPPVGIAICSTGVTKPKTNFLPLVTGEKLDILEMKACPRGTWICKNSSGMLGFVSTATVSLDPASVRGFLDAIPKPQRAELSAEGLPLETLPSSAGINILPTEECQIKARQASEATQRLVGPSGAETAEGSGSATGEGDGNGEEGAETATAAETEEGEGGDEEKEKGAETKEGEDGATTTQGEAGATGEAEEGSDAGSGTESPYDQLKQEPTHEEADGYGEDTYAVPDEVSGNAGNGGDLLYEDTPVMPPGAPDDMYEAVEDALQTAPPSDNPPPVPAPRRTAAVSDPVYAQPGSTDEQSQTTQGKDAGQSNDGGGGGGGGDGNDDEDDDDEVYACMDDANVPTADAAAPPAEEVYLAMQPRQEAVYENPSRKDKRGAYENVTLPFEQAKPTPKPRGDRQDQGQQAPPDLPPRKEESS